MILEAKRIGGLFLHLTVGLALLGWPRVGSAQGTWSVIARDGDGPGQVGQVMDLAADGAGNLYVAEGGRIQKRDAQGNWSVIAPTGSVRGEINNPTALAADAEGNLYVADRFYDNDSGYDHDSVFHNRIQKRDAQGNWSMVSDELRSYYRSLDDRLFHRALTVDAVGSLYVSWVRNTDLGRIAGIEKRDAQGNWSVIATNDGSVSGQLHLPIPAALAVDAAGNLYIGDGYYVYRRDAQENWLEIATSGSALGQVSWGASALAVDAAGNLYVADWSVYDGNSRIQKRDAQGNWSMIATAGNSLGQVDFYDRVALAVDGAGNLYVADTGNHRVQNYTPAP